METFFLLKFLYYICTTLIFDMKKNLILEKTGEIFLKFGFKSVTMDDIANDLGISKKTIYQYFKNKEDLIAQVVAIIHQDLIAKIDYVCSLEFNAIEENFEIKKIFKNLFKEADSSPMHQLQKYYPKIANNVTKTQFKVFKECVKNNITKGIEQGLYQKNINTSVISTFYFALAMSIHNNDLFLYQKNSLKKLEIEALTYHTKAIATPKGMEVLNEQLLKYHY